MVAVAPSAPKKVLIVTGDCPSHPYACVKLATVLAARHDVTVAGPNGPALSRLKAETARHRASTAGSSSSKKRRIGCASIGDVSTVVHCNVRPVVDPRDYSPLGIIFDTVFRRDRIKYGLAGDFERMMDDQVGTYETLKGMIPDYDLVYAIHTAAGTVGDAIESLKQEGAEAVPPLILFSSLPYNSGFFRKGTWSAPRPIVAIPHVATYSSPTKVIKESSFFLLGLVRCLAQLFWMRLDAHHAERAWRIAARRTDARRASRGLPPADGAARHYWRNHPVLSLGGVAPYVAEGDRIAENATAVGSLRSATATSDLGRLEDWIGRAKVGKVIYVSFGTGTQLDDEEAGNLARMAASMAGTEYSVLLSLSRDSQERLGHVFERAMGTEATRAGDGFCEYHDGKFRIDDDVPQENLLLSNSRRNDVRVEVFVSHMGFGGYTEAVHGGVPLVAYPSGCDQWYNAERAVEAGVAVRANPKMRDLDATVRAAMNDGAMRERSRRLSADMAKFDGDRIVLDMVDEICEGGTSEAVSTCGSGAS